MMETSSLWQMAVVPLLLVGVLINLYALHKIRKVHLATYPLLEDVHATRRETEALFAQFHALLALERKLDLPTELPPMRGWAGSPDFLLVVANTVLRKKPATVMECSSGVSTIVIARCLQINGTGHVYSLEHDTHYAAKTNELLRSYDLSEWATVVHAPLEAMHNATPWYAEHAIPRDISPIELLVVDGPPAMTAPLARLPALPRLMERLATNATIIMDDADRDDEKSILAHWCSHYPAVLINTPPCEKGCAILEVEKSPTLTR